MLPLYVHQRLVPLKPTKVHRHHHRHFQQQGPFDSSAASDTGLPAHAAILGFHRGPHPSGDADLLAVPSSDTLHRLLLRRSMCELYRSQSTYPTHSMMWLMESSVSEVRNGAELRERKRTSNHGSIWMPACISNASLPGLSIPPIHRVGIGISVGILRS